MFNIVTPDYNHAAARDFFTASLHASINYLLDFYEIYDVQKSPALCWQMCAAHYLAAKCAEADDHKGAVKYLRYLNKIPLVNDKNISVSPLTSADTSFDKQMILRIISDDDDLGFGFCDDPQLAATETDKIYRALAVIREHVPDSFNEISTFIQAVHLTQETDNGACFMRSGTNFYMWGLVFAYINEEHTVPYYIDILAHECGHTALNILNSFDELILNDPDETYKAPLLIDNSPLFDLFHALFVLSRICYVFDTIIKHGSSEYSEECQERFAVSYKKLSDTHQIIKKNGKFTDLGHQVYREICQRWQLDQ